ncbi:MAG: ATP synthase F1 subunit delta [Ignavibacteriaceae bacterium]|jgi:F-type H+-transporting ATPase subunit delta|nr:ATP synthase F1 subunit delta [Ignavibacteriaceae bacterium]MCW9095867.1 ATP synthase F1 subunit delta [Ignavibacteriaceae bacterium]
MADFRVLHRYAVSLLETAVEKKNLDVVTTDVQLLVDTLRQNRQLELMLESPVIRPELKLKIMEEVFRKKISKDSMDFIEFVISKQRENLLQFIGNRFLELRDEHLGIADVVVKAATEFTNEQKNLLQSRLEKILNKKVRLNFKIDLDLIGGFIAKVGDTLYDASIKHQLELLKKQFLTGEFSLN